MENRNRKSRRPTRVMPVAFGESKADHLRVGAIEERGHARTGKVTREIGRGIIKPSKTDSKQLMSSKKLRAGSGSAKDGEVRHGNQLFQSFRRKTIRNMPKNRCGRCRCKVTISIRVESDDLDMHFCPTCAKDMEKKYKGQ
tara:strand:+ start:466 stop:888 length:423 start_codon:yes stop_codon:yes gene_type:complete